MKKRKLTTFVLLSGIFVFSAFSVQAFENTTPESTNPSITQETSTADIPQDILDDVIFEHLDENEKVLRLPDGGWLYGGEITETDENGNIINSYNSETDPNSITVKEARIIDRNERIEEFRNLN